MTPLPVHGFVLAGGKSSRMGEDKALLPFRGRPMVEIAVQKLREFCAVVSIAGNRGDLVAYAPVVREEREGCGPAAGVEAGLRACSEAWAVFLPVDVPLVPAPLLRMWVEAVLDGGRSVECRASFLMTPDGRQPAFCMVRRECLAAISARLDRGETRLADILAAADAEFGAGSLWIANAARFVNDRAMDAGQIDSELRRWFSNVNTPGDLADAENQSASYEEQR